MRGVMVTYPFSARPLDEPTALGLLKVTSLESPEPRIQMLQGAVVTVHLRWSGEYGGLPVSADLRFKRVWTRCLGDAAGQIAAAHSVPAA